ncbi:MAG TPA: hypothetical protein VFH67_02580 [bacterium]|nr:hypothetical protein [bacterium]
MRGLSIPIHEPVERQITGRSGLDWWVAVVSSLLIGGVYLDGWAHIHRGQIETFFTPWHAALYSGFAAVAAILIGATWRNRSQGLTGTRAIPAGYEQSLLGVLLFTVGGMADMLWHVIFGIELDLEALLSPTHLLLATGGVLIVSGPFRAAWLDSGDPERSLRGYFPILLSMTLLLAVLGFMSQYMHPFGTTWAAGTRGHEWLGEVGQARVSGFTIESYFTFFSQMATIGGIILQTAIFMGLVLLAIRRWRLPAGSLSLMVTASITMMVLMRHRFIAPGPLPMIGVAALAGVAADVLLVRLRPSPERPAAVRWFAFTVPVLLYATYFAALALTTGTWWSVHLWTGAIVLAGLVGLLMSFMVVPLSNSAAIHSSAR